MFGNFFSNHRIYYTSKELFGKAEKCRETTALRRAKIAETGLGVSFQAVEA
jgi:hypothetical protein